MAAALTPPSRRPAGRPIPGASPGEERSLGRLGVHTLEEMLFWFPRWHVHRSRLRSFAEAREGVRDHFLARIARVGVFKRGRLHIIRVTLADDASTADLYLFNRPYLSTTFKAGRPVLVVDAPERTGTRLRFGGQAGTVEPVTDADLEALESGRMVVYYRSTTVVSQPRARELAWACVAQGLDAVEDPLPDATRERLGLLPLREALRQAHRPDGWTEWERARRRLAFDQAFLLQVALGRSRRELAAVRKGRQYELAGARLAKFNAALPFPLTGAQRRVIAEVTEDLGRPSPMNRLVQGDVGSGKTVVAAAAAAVAGDSGLQAAVLAPTEILAEQHFHTFRRLLGSAGSRVGLLSGSLGKVERRQLLAGLATGYFDVVVGTHALLEPDVAIPKLGLAVIDERHKFGVRQRALLEAKGDRPDVLLMTATPLPRAMVLTQYGDTALSLLDEMPPGRGGITTEWAHGAARRDEAYRFAAGRLALGERAFAVFPLVEESEHLALRDATAEYDRLRRVFPGVPMALLHGRMGADEKEAAMADFASGRCRFLVCTTVVEVGIDVPQATVMLVEHANRFGLSQLHQLRGRIGRGAAPSWCYLVTTGNLTADAKVRMETLRRTLNGFELAEADLKLRGPGELFGTRQHGEPDAEFLEVLLDPVTLESARREAEGVLDADPELNRADGRRVRRALKDRLSKRWGLARAS